MLVPTLSLLLSSNSPQSHDPPPLTTGEAASGILGSVSLACWIFLLLPQLIENYRNGSAEAVSLAFICVWFLGDVCNLVGALWAGLVPVIVAIAVYFCISDGVLIGQCGYYGIRARRREAKRMLKRGRGESLVGGRSAVERGEEAVGEAVEEDSEQSPLLKNKSRERRGSYNGTIPGSEERRRPSAGSAGTRRRSSQNQARNEQLTKILEERDENGVRLWSKNIASVLGIIIVGVAGWAAAYGTGAWRPVPPPPTHSHVDPSADDMATGAQVLGYASAVLYLGARLPQIYKNWQQKSCEGLSLLFFVLSLLGNLTYGAGILCHSQEKDYVMKNVPWLIGSLGTMVEDVVIFGQFHVYRKGKAVDVAVD